VRLSAVWLGLLLPAALAAQAARRPTPHAHRTGTFLDRRITESSGVVVSRRYRGLLWTMNDSGGDAALFLTDTTGAARGMFAVPRAANIDWEALSFGPCGPGKCLFIGDTGDNDERRASVTIYRLPEPEVSGSAGASIAARAEAVEVVYPDRPHDVEAMYVEPDGTVMLITKGRRGGVLAFRVPAAGWQHRRVAAVLVDSLPIKPSLLTGRVVTDAAISPDARRVAIRSYREVWFFTRESNGRLAPDPRHPACDIAGLEPQGEGLDWWDGDTLVLTSERGLYPAGTITLLRCPAA
jgi:hypothetical protein